MNMLKKKLKSSHDLYKFNYKYKYFNSHHEFEWAQIKDLKKNNFVNRNRYKFKIVTKFATVSIQLY